LPPKVWVGISLFRDFVFNGKTDLYVRFGVPEGSANEHCRLEICTGTCWGPENVLRTFVVFIT
jgi:hypothetical protein